MARRITRSDIVQECYSMWNRLDPVVKSPDHLEGAISFYEMYYFNGPVNNRVKALTNMEDMQLWKMYSDMKFVLMIL